MKSEKEEIVFPLADNIKAPDLTKKEANNHEEKNKISMILEGFLSFGDQILEKLD